MSFPTKPGRLLALGLTLTAAAPAEIKVGDTFPALAPTGTVNVAGGKIPPTAGRVVLVDFWASWCAPCKASFPALARLHADYAGRGLLIIAVGLADQHDRPADARSFLQRQAPPFVVLRDAADKLVPLVAPPAMPASYLLGRDGRVRFVHRGFHGEPTDREVRREIDQLLAENPPVS